MRAGLLVLIVIGWFVAGCAPDRCGISQEVSEIPMLASQGHAIVPLTINDVVLGLRLETANEESSHQGSGREA